MTGLARCPILLVSITLASALAQPLGMDGSVVDDARWSKRLLLICGQSNAALGSPLQKAQFDAMPPCQSEMRPAGD